MISHYIMVALGGAIGAVLRVALGHALPVTVLGVPFPILLVNILGCLIMGFITEMMALYWSVTDNYRYFLISGLLGGFTTFSAFALEFGLLVDKNQYLAALLYVFLSVALSLTFFFIGVKIVRLI
jgi:CrcB protein